MPSKVKFKPRNFMRVLRYIKAHRDKWDQGCWTRLMCRSSQCFAGWAQFFATGENSLSSVRNDAQEWLGLTRGEGRWLFGYKRTISDFEQFYRERVKSDA